MISWCSQKQIFVSTSYNHAEVIMLHEASRECVWLSFITQHIQVICGLPINKNPTVLFEYNAARVTQMNEGYIKSNRTKYILQVLLI